MRTLKMYACALLCAALAAGPARAQDKPGAGTAKGAKIVVEIKSFKEMRVKKDGKTSVELVSAEKSRKGDTLVYVISYRNEGDAPAKEASIGDPIPRGMVFVSGSAEAAGADLSFSLDGGKTFQAPPLTVPVQGPDGKTVQKPAPPEMISHLRWTLKSPVPPGGGGEFRFKVKVK